MIKEILFCFKGHFLKFLKPNFIEAKNNVEENGKKYSSTSQFVAL